MSNITLLVPFPNNSVFTQYEKEEFKNLPDLTVIGTDTGLDVVTDLYHIEYHIGPLLDKAIEIEKRGNCDALIIGCFGDPGLLAVRQVTSMLVLGPGETSLCAAAMIGHKIGIIIPEMQFVPFIENTVRTYGFNNRVVALRSAEDFVPESVLTRPEESVKKMTDTCLKLIREDDADVVILGCVGFAWMICQVRELIAKEGLKTPLIEPGITAYNAAKMFVELGLNQDRRKLTRLFHRTRSTS